MGNPITYYGELPLISETIGYQSMHCEASSPTSATLAPSITHQWIKQPTLNLTIAFDDVSSIRHAHPAENHLFLLVFPSQLPLAQTQCKLRRIERWEETWQKVTSASVDEIDFQFKHGSFCFVKMTNIDFLPRANGSLKIGEGVQKCCYRKTFKKF